MTPASPLGSTSSVPVLKPLDRLLTDARLEPVSVNLTNFVANVELMKLVRYTTTNHETIFRSAKNVASKLADGSELVYLLDCDVIRSYCEAPFLDNQYLAFSLNYLLSWSPARYGIPLGAFEELLAYISYPHRANRLMPALLSSPSGRLSGDESFHVVCRAFGVEGHEADEKGLRRRLGRHANQLARLQELLTNERCVGVVSRYDSRVFEGWLDVIRRRSRDNHDFGDENVEPKPRSRRDERDAQNLAIATTDYQSPEQPPNDTSLPDITFLLLTRTSTLLELMRDADLELTQSHVGGRPSVVLQHEYPVVHPRVAMVFEMIGGSRHRRAAETRARGFEENLKWLGSILDDEIATRGREQIPIAITEATKWRRERLLRSAMQRVAKDILFAQGALVDVAECIAEDENTVSQDAEMRREVEAGYLDLASSLSRVEVAVGDIGALEYRTSVTDGGGGVLSFLVCQSLGDQACTLIEGQIYQDRGYYTVRWPTSASEEAIIGGLRGIIDSTNIQASASSINHCAADSNAATLVALKGPHPYRDRGFVVTTALGDYGADLQTAFGGGAWPLLRRSRLRTELARMDGLFSLGGRPSIPSIVSYEVAAEFGSFHVDMLTDDGRRREIVVTSRKNLAQHLATLFMYTGRRYCSRTRLADGLAALLAQHPSH